MKLGKNVEKIRDDLYVRKGKLGYMVVYPPKNEDGTVNWRNIIVGDAYSLINWIIFAMVIFLIYYGGVVQLNDKYEDYIDLIIDDACDICMQQKLNPENPYVPNFTIDVPPFTIDVPPNIIGGKENGS